MYLCFFFFVADIVSLLSTTGRAKVLYNQTAVSNLTVFLNVLVYFQTLHYKKQLRTVNQVVRYEFNLMLGVSNFLLVQTYLNDN